MAAGIADHCWSVEELLRYRMSLPRWCPARHCGRRSLAEQALTARWATWALVRWLLASQLGDHGSKRLHVLGIHHEIRNSIDVAQVTDLIHDLFHTANKPVGIS